MSAPAFNTRVLIVEDDIDIAQLLEACLRRQGFKAESAPDGTTAWAALGKGTFDLVLLDWMLPDVSGLELCRAIREGRINPGIRELPILMVTARTDPADIATGLRAGADDYLTKPFEAPMLLARVQALLRRTSEIQRLMQEPVVRLGALQVDLRERVARLGDQEIDLGEEEFRLLAALLAHRGRVLSRERLASLLQQPSAPSASLESRVASLRAKLGSGAELIEIVRGVGFRIRLG